MLAAIARIARTGAFVKDGAHLESLSTVVFDKTGTLTTGTPAVIGVRTAEGITDDGLLTFAAAAEAYSEHPLGQAILTHARRLDLPLESVLISMSPRLGR